MSNPALAHLDALIHKTCSRVGLASTATYRLAGQEAQPGHACRIYYDEARQFFGEFGQVAGARRVISILREDIPTPAVNAQLIDGSSIYRLETPLETSDESLSAWVVLQRPGDIAQNWEVIGV